MVSAANPGQTISRIAEIGLLILASVDVWVVVDTRRALRLLGQLGLMRPVLAYQRPGWVWFYRINGTIVLIGFIELFAQGKLFR